MKLYLKNVGKIKEADVNIEGITVMAGVNDTGKSTIGKALYAIFNSLYKIKERNIIVRKNNLNNFIDRQINNETISSIAGFANFFEQRNKRSHINRKFLDKLFDIKGCIKDNQTLDETFNKMIKEYVKLGYRIEKPETLKERVIERFNLSSEEIIREIVQSHFDVEFNNQVNNFNSGKDEYAEVNLEIKNDNFVIKLKNNNVYNIEHPFDLITEAVYVDDTTVIDNLYSVTAQSSEERSFNKVFNYFQIDPIYNHKDHIKHLLTTKKNSDYVEKVFNAKRLNNVLENINDISNGQLIKEDDEVYYTEDDKAYNILNVSEGLKTFIILKSLILTGCIEERGTIILDEPEVHLHPEWQLKLAELIVLLQKEFKLHILISSHSPYFIRAIEVYANKHNINEKCSYYIVKSVDGKSSKVYDTTGNLEEIYELLAKPFDILEEEVYENEVCYNEE